MSGTRRRFGRSPAKARFLSDLSPAMQKALLRCNVMAVLVDAPVVPAVTLAALERHGLIEQTRDRRMRLVWKPSSKGLRLIVTEEPRLPAARSQYGYTPEPAQAMREEPEAVDETAQERITARASMETEQWLVLERANRDRMELHERLRQAQESARLAGVDVRRQELSILRRIESLESKVRKLAA